MTAKIQTIEVGGIDILPRTRTDAVTTPDGIPIDEKLEELVQRISNKAAKSSIVNATLLAASWTGSSAPYSYILSVTGVTPTSVQDLLPMTTATEAELKTLQAANIQDGGQVAGSITLKAWGTKPEIDLPIRVILRGDM